VDVSWLLFGVLLLTASITYYDFLVVYNVDVFLIDLCYLILYFVARSRCGRAWWVGYRC